LCRLRKRERTLGVRRSDPMAATKVCNVRFEGNVITTTVTASGAAVESWLDEILSVHRRRLHKLVVGLDVEWRPSFSRAYSKTAILQLCVGRRCLIFQLLHADYVPNTLDEFLSDPDYTFVGVGVAADVERLENDYDLEVANAEDLAELAAKEMGRPDLRNAGLQGIARAVMDAHVEKPQWVRTGPWDASSLSDEQIEYATIDAFVSFEVGRMLLSGYY
jgi:ribonuclease D